METCLLAGLFAALAAAAPFAAGAASQAAFAGALHARDAQLATSHPVRAELTQPATDMTSGYTLTAYVPVQATWTSPTGIRHAGQVLVPDDSRKGSIVTVWANAAGNLVSPPLLPSQVAGNGDVAALGAITGLGVLYLGSAVVVRGVANRRRMAAWDADWLVTARLWNRQQW